MIIVVKTCQVDSKNENNSLKSVHLCMVIQNYMEEATSRSMTN